MTDNWEQESHRSTIQFAIEGIRALLLANGGAVLAILTFAGNTITTTGAPMIDLQRVAYSLRLFGIGLALAVFTTVLSYA